MKKVVRLLILFALLAAATRKPGSAYAFCGYPYPCSFVQDDCEAAGGTFSAEYLYNCEDVSNQVRQLYYYSCSGRNPWGGYCYV